MKRAAVSLVVAELFLLSTIALAQPGSGSGSSTSYVVQRGMSFGRGYHLTSLAWRVSGTASGEGYSLMEPAAPELRGNGCCCTYLPCITHNF